MRLDASCPQVAAPLPLCLRWRAHAAEDGDDGGVDCGALAKFRQAISGEEGEAAAAEAGACLDLRGEHRSGGIERGGRRRTLRRAGERREEGSCADVFAERPPMFAIIAL